MTFLSARPISRRSALGLAAVSAGALAGCTRPEPSSGSSTASGSVRVGMISSNPQYEPFFTAQMKELGAQSGVRVETIFYPPKDYANAMQLAFRSGDAPDIYRMTGPTPALNLSNSSRNSWLRPLDEFVTDDFRSRPFPEGTFDRPEASGLHVDGKLYALPLESLPYTQIRILYCNMELLGEAGFDTPPTTYGEMAEMARKVSADGDKNFGFAIAGQQTVVTVDALQSTGGVPMAGLAPINYRTGAPGASEDSYTQVVKLLGDLNGDKVLTPGWESWDGTRPITEFAAGRLAMYVGANFHAAQIRQLAPNLDFQMANIPVPDDGRKGYMPIRGLNIAYWGMNADAQDPGAAWSVLDHLSTLGFQTAAYQALKLIPVLSSGMSEVFEGDTVRLVEIMSQSQRLAPSAGFKGQEYDDLVGAVTGKAPKPTATERYTTAITGSSDYVGPAEEFDSGFAQVIAAEAKAAGLPDDALAFPEWNPMEDYRA